MSQSEDKDSFVSRALMVVMIVGAVVGMFVVAPSAAATWYSRCFNISLLYGFGLVFSALAVAVLTYMLGGAESEINQYIWLIYGVVMSLMSVYGVFLQFSGKCDLGRI